MKTSVIIPCYNEEENLRKLFVSWIENIKGQEFEVIFVENGSTDNSKEVLKELALQFEEYSKNFKVLVLDINQGYGGGIQKGLDVATGDILSWCHADGQVDITSIIMALEEYKKLSNYDVVLKGKRRNRNNFDLFFTKMMTIIVRLFTGFLLNDINAQPKIFSKNIYKNQFLEKDFLFDLDFLLYQRKDGVEIKEVEVANLPRLRGKAKGGGSLIGKIKLSYKTLIYLINLHEYRN